MSIQCQPGKFLMEEFREHGGEEAPRKMEIVTLTDDEGESVDFEFLDLITYSGRDYAVLVPTDEAADQVVIFEVEDADQTTNSFIPVTSESVARAVFELFRNRNSDLYDFS